MSLTVDLQLDDRRDDRVVVSIRLEPLRGSQRVDGVALELRDDAGERLGPRLLLPVSGTLAGPLITRAELLAERAICAEARIVATAWWGCEQVQATCPCDHGTRFAHHVLGRRSLPLRAEPDELAPLLDEERAALVARLPWLDEPRSPPTPPETLTAEIVIPAPQTESDAVTDEICECFGLDGENARWLKELLETEEA